MKFNSLFAALIFACALPLAHAQVGAAYDTHDPRVCKSTREPVKGPISAEKAKEYLICGEEHEETRSDELVLLDVSKVEVGTGRPFDIRSDSSEADVKSLVYPIRGSETSYRCHKLSNGYKHGQNCFVMDLPHATGTCFRTGFGDWKCHMFDFMTRSSKTGAAPAR